MRLDQTGYSVEALTDVAEVASKPGGALFAVLSLNNVASDFGTTNK